MSRKGDTSHVRNNGLFIHSSSHDKVRIAATINDGRVSELPKKRSRRLSFSYYELKISLSTSHGYSATTEYAHPLGSSTFLAPSGNRGISASSDAYGRIDPGVIIRR